MARKTTLQNHKFTNKLLLNQWLMSQFGVDPPTEPGTGGTGTGGTTGGGTTPPRGGGGGTTPPTPNQYNTRSVFMVE